ncbi:MAG: DUF2484 family protein [Paracoccaceae bacterium]
MTGSFIAACLWLLLANVTAMTPSRDYHWRAAYGLIALAIPTGIWLAIQSGPLWALGFCLAAGSVLRWPVIYLWRWLKRKLAG